MLTRDRKEHIIDELVKDLSLAKSVVFVDFQSVTANAVTGLKKDLRCDAGVLRVVRKTLLRIASEKAGVPVDMSSLDGQGAVAFSFSDEVSVPKKLVAFSKTNETFRVLSGLLGTVAMTAEEVVALSALPSKDELRGMVVGTIAAPLSGFVNVLTGPARGFVQVLKAVSDQKSVTA
ncbi:MAG: 50S ribosomal protein L10 [Candidatus Moranbacteria bacterium]|nr:50S ribosomal protein L10 [Candidatus Moranbacteria bacterium]